MKIHPYPKIHLIYAPTNNLNKLIWEEHYIDMVDILIDFKDENPGFFIEVSKFPNRRMIDNAKTESFNIWVWEY
jgi:hypothetical protein